MGLWSTDKQEFQTSLPRKTLVKTSIESGLIHACKGSFFQVQFQRAVLHFFISYWTEMRRSSAGILWDATDATKLLRLSWDLPSLPGYCPEIGHGHLNLPSGSTCSKVSNSLSTVKSLKFLSHFWGPSNNCSPGLSLFSRFVPWRWLEKPWMDLC